MKILLFYGFVFGVGFTKYLEVRYDNIVYFLFYLKWLYLYFW